MVASIIQDGCVAAVTIKPESGASVPPRFADPQCTRKAYGGGAQRLARHPEVAQANVRERSKYPAEGRSSREFVRTLTLRRE